MQQKYIQFPAIGPFRRPFRTHAPHLNTQSLGLSAMPQIHCLFLILVIAFAISGCNGDRVEELESQIDDLESELESVRSKLSDAESEVGTLGSAVDDLESQLEGVRSKLSDAESEAGTLRGAVDDLVSAVGELEYTDWRIVLPNVQSAAGDVESAARSVESLIVDAASAAQ